MKRNRFIRLSGGTRTVNRKLEQKAHALAGLKAHLTIVFAALTVSRSIEHATGHSTGRW